MRHVLFTAIACTLLACGGNDDTGNDKKTGNATGVDLTLSPTAISVAAGASATVTVTLIRGTSVQGESVDVAVAGMPNGVSASFASASTTADTADLTITVSASAPAGTSTLTVTASDATSFGTASVALTITTANAGPT
jgi:hypothetical protein